MKGTRVRIVAAGTQRALLPTFPGWGADLEECKRHMRPIVNGETATITGVESHGMNPWTRYTLQFDDGSRTAGFNPANTEVI